MRKWLILSAALLLLSGQHVFAQANIKPDTTPRLPAQPGESLSLEDQRFFTRAVNLSEAENEAARLGAEKAGSAGLKQLSGEIGALHQKLLQSVKDLAQKNRVALQPHASKASWQGDVQRMRGLSGSEFDREFLRWQLQIHLTLVDLYQTQASNSPQTDLAKFAIVSLAQIKPQFDRAQQLGAEQGIAINTVKAPPQY